MKHTHTRQRMANNNNNNKRSHNISQWIYETHPYKAENDK